MTAAAPRARRPRPAAAAPEAEAASTPARALDLVPTEQELKDAADQGLVVYEGTITVQRVAYQGEIEVERLEGERTVQVPLFHTAPARIRIGSSTTRNLGDFNSCKVEASIELPCYPVESEIGRAYHAIAAMLDEIIPVELAKGGVYMGEPQPADEDTSGTTAYETEGYTDETQEGGDGTYDPSQSDAQ